MEEKRDVKEFLVSELSNLAFPMFVASALSEIWLLLLTLSLLSLMSLLLLLLFLLSMLATTLDTAVAETTAKVRNPVTEKTLFFNARWVWHHHLGIFLRTIFVFIFTKSVTL